VLTTSISFLFWEGRPCSKRQKITAQTGILACKTAGANSRTTPHNLITAEPKKNFLKRKVFTEQAQQRVLVHKTNCEYVVLAGRVLRSLFWPSGVKILSFKKCFFFIF
jgi:hypothetical protein